jgi:hypothetical protein
VLIRRAPEQETVMHFVTKHQDGRDLVTGARMAKPAYVFGGSGEPGTYIICTDCADPEHLAVIRTLASSADPPAL